ncbi:phage tail-like protein [Paracoccus pantotrophus]|uniref:Phage tail protein n=1 Tax=Paracoccus pantotrophus TaxID=82367 RepID=A0A1I5FQD8_PARPN|nr:phage tail protein [Paracoccus pantotrophus]MDF3854165.1 phage tail protein [Paracoccus pantotrophus]QFG36315.1 phage tail protein [Paracoccus pantotrophus]QLH16889.1 phage tail protein [Paracoccus pantotrophus]RKS43102.1 phage tail-like protein [Paracoccus pantotrophus]RNI14276.1 phage tail protein [Paracoccus pantotrophus]
MPMFNVNAHRIDPYKNFRFRVTWDGRVVAALSKMSAVKKTTEAIEWRVAADAGIVRKMPGRTKFEPVTFESGLTHDRQFLEWANQVNNPQGEAANSLVNYRKSVRVEVLNMQGVPVMAFNLMRAWASEFQALPEMDANANAVAIQTLKVEYENFVLDEAVTEPAET